MTLLDTAWLKVARYGLRNRFTDGVHETFLTRRGAERYLARDETLPPGSLKTATVRIPRSTYMALERLTKETDVKKMGFIENACGVIAGYLITEAGKRAYRRGDEHELAHARAALKAGNTHGDSHRWGCPLKEPGQGVPAEEYWLVREYDEGEQVAEFKTYFGPVMSALVEKIEKRGNTPKVFAYGLYETLIEVGEE